MEGSRCLNEVLEGPNTNNLELQMKRPTVSNRNLAGNVDNLDQTAVDDSLTGAL